MTIRAPSSAVVFVQIVRGDEVPLNVALPASQGGGETCILTVEDRAGVLYVSALPAAGRVGRAAQYLAAGENQYAALLITGPEAEDLLYRKITDPVGAAVGGYVLLRLGALERTHDWTDNLAARFRWLPDGAIIAGEKAAMLGDHVRAANYFLQAGQRGLPLFTDGLSILVSRLRQYQTNARIRARLSQDRVAAVRELSDRLEGWSPFVDFGAPTLTFRAAELTRPVESQHRVDLRDFPWWVDRDGHLQTLGQPPVARRGRAKNLGGRGTAGEQEAQVSTSYGSSAWDPWTYPESSGMTAAGDVNVVGFDVEATDGRIGKIDEATYDVGGSYIVVDTGPWIFGKKVMLPAGTITRVDTGDRKVYVDRTKGQIKDAPEFDKDNYTSSDYRDKLGAHYRGPYPA